ncbi:MAG TPA: hypothetical protein VLA67_03690 [Nitrospiraceae bacterium]|nr:hypothetical protein [Nitrospiraceae bacterium]
MGTHTADPAAIIPRPLGQSDHQHGNRTPVRFSVLYSGMNPGQMRIGGSIVTDLSQGGIGIHGNRSVAPSMGLALFIDLPERGSSVHCPKPGLLGCGTSFRREIRVSETGG